MTNRPRNFLRTSPLVALVVVVLAACGSSSIVSSPKDVVTVDGNGYPKDDFDLVANDLITAGQFKSVNGVLSVTDARTLIRTLVDFESFPAFLEARGVSTSESDRSSILDQANADESFKTFSKPLQDLLVELNVASLTLKKVKTPPEAELRRMYGASPASTGVLCLSHILVKSESEARAVLAGLDKGAKFADLAAAKSIEPGADKSGGALKNGQEACSPLRDLQASFDKAFLAGAVAAKAGVPYGPVKSSFGYHVILNRPFDEVKDSVSSVISKDPGGTLLTGFMTGVDVKVNSTYGHWNAALATIE